LLYKNLRTKLVSIRVGLFFLLLGVLAPQLSSANAQEGPEEIPVAFSYNAVGNVAITALYDNGQIFLPVRELFYLLLVPCERTAGQYELTGIYLDPDRRYIINFSSQIIRVGSKDFSITPGDFRITDLDFYLTPEIFAQVFGLNFEFNLSQVSLHLESEHKLPVELQAERERARRNMQGRQIREKYPPAGYERNRSFLRGGVADYQLSMVYQGGTAQVSLDAGLGMEVLGGDIRGNFSVGSVGDNLYFNSNSLQWRYAILENPWISSINAGFISSNGLMSRSIIGAGISNDPIEPRRLFESYVIDGTTEPESEVELYVNNQLVDFQRADETGYYRFSFPLTFGTTRVSITIYTPSGEIKTQDQHIQIPYTFLPKGEFSYHLQGGLTNTYGSDDYIQAPVVTGDISYGLTKWLTAKVGAEYLTQEYGTVPLLYSSLSARIFSQYLVNLDIVPNYMYRATGNVLYSSNRSVNVTYTRYDGESVFNRRKAVDELTAGFYLPVDFKKLKFGFRISGDYINYGTHTAAGYRADLNFRIGKINFNTNYRDNLVLTNGTVSRGQGALSEVITYSVPNSKKIPGIFRGIYLRGQASYSLYDQAFEEFSLQLSKSVFKSGYLTLSGSYLPIAKTPYVQMGLSVNLERIRSNSRASYRTGELSLYQSFRGSVGYDYKSRRFSTTNLDQVGRAAVSVLLFVDDNVNGKWDKGEERLPYKAVRLDQSATIQVDRDSVIRITQLQSYFRYNMEVNRNQIKNPMLAPALDKFSFVADPNQYKRIEIPFYRTGVAEGIVSLEQEGLLKGLGGLRLQVLKEGGDDPEVVKTFSSGDFYVMDLAPGQYTIQVDPIQLDFLDAEQLDGPYRFEIKPMVDGDFVEGIQIILIKK